MEEARYATELDAPILAELNQEMIEASGHKTDLDRQALEQRMRSWLALRDYECVLFFRSIVPIGYALFRGGSEIHLRQFLIRQPYRRGGVGRSAFRFLTGEVWGSAHAVQLDVHSDNYVALSFWRSLGFQGQPEAMRLTIASNNSLNTDRLFHWRSKAARLS
jgi:ribosomal protein S18 acetylase RimI-like enzyme